MKIIKILLILLLIIFPLGQLTRLSAGKINFYWQDLIIGLINIIYLIIIISRNDFSFKNKTSFARHGLTKLVFIFTIIMGLSLAVNYESLPAEQIVTGILYLLRWVAYAGVCFLIKDLMESKSLKVSSLKKGLIWAGIASGFLGLLQYFVYPDLRNLSYLGYDPHKFRAFGTFFDPNFLGIILVLTIILVINEQRKKLVVLGGLGILVSYIALTLTYSRSSYLAYFISMSMMAFFLKSWKWWLIMILIGITTIIFLPQPVGSVGVQLQREETITSRIENWKQSLLIFKDHPVTGIGIKSVRADSSFLFILATTGIFGFLSYLGILGTIWKKGSLVIKASLAAVAIHSFFNNTLFYPWVMLWLWMIIGTDYKEE